MHFTHLNTQSLSLKPGTILLFPSPNMMNWESKPIGNLKCLRKNAFECFLNMSNYSPEDNRRVDSKHFCYYYNFVLLIMLKSVFFLSVVPETLMDNWMGKYVSNRHCYLYILVVLCFLWAVLPPTLPHFPIPFYCFLIKHVSIWQIKTKTKQPTTCFVLNFILEC